MYPLGSTHMYPLGSMYLQHDTHDWGAPSTWGTLPIYCSDQVLNTGVPTVYGNAPQDIPIETFAYIAVMNSNIQGYPSIWKRSPILLECIPIYWGCHPTLPRPTTLALLVSFPHYYYT